MNTQDHTLLVKPTFDMSEQNRPQKLSEHVDASLSQNGVSLSGKLTIEFGSKDPYLIWILETRDFRDAGFESKVNFGACEITFGKRKFTGQIVSTGSHSIIGWVIGEVSIGTQHKLTSFTTHLIHCPVLDVNGARVKLGAALSRPASQNVELVLDEWKIQISSCQDVNESLGFRGLIRVTHEGEFKQELVSPLLEQLYYFLSFSFGSWVSPFLTSGSNAEYSQFFKHSIGYKSSNEWDLKGWLPNGMPNCLEAAFPGFVGLFLKEDWREPLIAAIDWLLDSITSTRDSQKKKMTFAQIPLEMLAWMVFSDSTEIIPENDFKSLSAASKISLVLNNARIPLGVPDDLTELLKVQSKYEVLNNGPKLIVKFRNTIIHPSKKNRLFLKEVEAECNVDLETVYRESLRLYQSYTTLVLLNLVGYRSMYANRLGTSWPPKTEIVPWA